MKCEKILLAVVLLLVALAVPASASVVGYIPVSGGQFTLIGADDAAGHIYDVWGDGTVYSVYDFSADGNIDMLLDLGTVTNVGAIEVQNRVDTGTNSSLAMCEIYVADETAPGFDPEDPCAYTINVFANGSPSPTNGNAGVWRSADITDSTRRYFLIHVTATWVPGTGEMPVQFSDLNFASPGFPVTAGKIFSVGDDVLEDLDAPNPDVFALYDGAAGTPNGSVDFVLDAQTVTEVAAIQIVNRADTSTNYNIALCEIYIAPDESAPGFDPTDAASYTVKVFGNASPSPATAEAGAVRNADITDSTRRYFLIHVTDTWAGFPANFDDIRVSSVVAYPAIRGRIFAIDGDEIYDNPSPDIFQIFNMTADDAAYIVYDLEAVAGVRKLKIINRLDTSTNLAMGQIEIWVAPDEADPCFDLTQVSSYTDKVYDGVFLPSTGDPGVERLAVIPYSIKQYFMIKIKTKMSGDMSQGEHVQVHDFDYFGNSDILTCQDVLDLGLTLEGDLYKDCYVNSHDLSDLASEWLSCTEPGPGCVKTSGSTPTYTIEKVPAEGISVDGNLNDWPADSEWMRIDRHYDGSYPWDVEEAMFSLRWDDANDMIYLAVVVDDPDHNFFSNPTPYADMIEVYSQGNAAGGTGWGIAGGTEKFDIAQHYFVAPKSGGHWASWADLSTIDTDAAFESSVAVDGDLIKYEVGIKQFNNYGGISGEATEVAELTPGSFVGFDVLANTVFGDAAFSSISENLYTSKYDDAGQFQQYELVNTLPQQYCGDWGYIDQDIDRDCIVALGDFAAMSANWLVCNDPNSVDCLNDW